MLGGFEFKQSFKFSRLHNEIQPLNWLIIAHIQQRDKILSFTTENFLLPVFKNFPDFLHQGI